MDMNSAGNGGAINATIYRQDYNNKTGTMGLTGETDSLVFPFELTEEGARFASFTDIW